MVAPASGAGDPAPTTTFLAPSPIPCSQPWGPPSSPRGKGFGRGTDTLWGHGDPLEDTDTTGEVKIPQEGVGIWGRAVNGGGVGGVTGTERFGP